MTESKGPSTAVEGLLDGCFCGCRGVLTCLVALDAAIEAATNKPRSMEVGS
jgi:hypothetical protein